MSPILGNRDGTAGDSVVNNLSNLNFRVPFGSFGDRYSAIGTDRRILFLDGVRSRSLPHRSSLVTGLTSQGLFLAVPPSTTVGVRSLIRRWKAACWCCDYAEPTVAEIS